MARRPHWALSTSLQIIIAVALVCAGLLVVFVIVPAVKNRSAQTGPVAAIPEPVPSGFFKLTDDEWQSLEFARVNEIRFPEADTTDGSVVAADDTTTQVFSPYTGRVTAVFATVGDSVRKGAPLFEVAGDEYAQAENDFAAAIETLRSARVQLQVTRVNRARLLALQKISGAATKDVEQSAADLAAAQTAVTNDETAVALVRSRLHVLGFSDAAVARLANAPRRGTLATGVVVYAPIAGVVTQRGVGIGQNVDSAANGSTTTLFTITDVSRVFFSAAVPETTVAKVHVGDPVLVRMLAFPNRTFDASVKYIAPTVDATTHRIFVRAEVPNPDGSLKPGMFGSMTISTGPAVVSVGVPEEAIIFEGDAARVWITGPDKTLALRNIRTGKSTGGIRQVLEGVRAGDHVVTSGAIFIDRALRGGD